jgi:hypothetical protein
MPRFPLAVEAVASSTALVASLACPVLCGRIVDKGVKKGLYRVGRRRDSRWQLTNGIKILPKNRSQ